MKSTTAPSRRQFLRLGLFGSGPGLFAYGSLIERRYPIVERIDCPLADRFGGLDGLSLAVMSDFHHDDFHDDTLMGRAIRAMNELQPDVVIFTGDYISHNLNGLDALAGHFSRIQARLGAYASLGNHDHWTGADDVVRRLNPSGLAMLRNDATELRAPSGEKFYVAGMESAWGGRPDLARALRGIPAGAPVLLGWHEPDPYDTIEDTRVAMQLSGHTHGGQVCAPFYGAIRLPSYGKKYVAGLYGEGDSRLYVTRGIGSMGVPVRFCCPPEITLITFRAKA